MGCTLVGTPLESFRFLTLQGFSGNVASSFQTSSLMGTLIFEARRWEEGKNDPMEISRFWRKELNRISIGEKYKKIISIL